MPTLEEIREEQRKLRERGIKEREERERRKAEAKARHEAEEEAKRAKARGTITLSTKEPTGIDPVTGKPIFGREVPKDVGKILKEGGRDVGAAMRLEAEQEAQQAAIDAETERIRTEEFPTRTTLDQPDLPGPFTETPFVGGAFRAATNVLSDFVLKTVPEGAFKEAFRGNLGVMTNEEINSFTITEIQKAELKEGVMMSEQFGQVAEVIPGSAKLADWMNVETPRSNVEQVFKDIKSIRRQANKIASDVRYGYKDQADGEQLIAELENYVNDKKARLQLLIINSPSLNFNSDRVNSFETDLFAVDNAIFDAKIEVAKGKILDPTELELYAKTQSLGVDNFEWITDEW